MTARESSPTYSRIQPLALRAYRLGIILVAVFIIRYHHQTQLIQGDAPITLSEVRDILPDAAAIATDLETDRRGLVVTNIDGRRIGYTLRTSPISDGIVGYSGRTDTLVVLGPDDKVVGVRIRYSDDTVEHVADVKEDEWHNSRWDDKTWEQVATMDFDEAGVEGVSGATYTSMAMAEGIRSRFAHSMKLERADRGIRFTWSDAGLVVVILAACGMMFTHLRGKKWLRRVYQIAIVGYVGFVSGDLLAQSLLAGWAKSGVAWRLAPGLALLTAAALIVPWATRRPLYCASICPHGIAQQWIGKLIPWRWKVPRKIEPGLRCLPTLLIVLVIFVTMMSVPFDLAGVEPFDAYLITTAGIATMAVAIAGLIFAAFVPMGYCKYGCPTGALLEYVRAHGHADKFGRRDIVAGLIVGLIALIWWQHATLHTMIVGGA